MRSLALAIFNATPFHALRSPIVAREIAVAGRRWTTYAMRSLFVFGVLAIVVLAFVSVFFDGGHRNTTEQLDQITALAPQLVTAMSWVMFVALMFLAPVLTCGAICEEKLGRTLPALLTTPLTSTQIVFGKLAARFVQLVLLVLCGVPVLLLLRVYGGYSMGMVLKGTCITLSAAFLASSVALMYSIWHKRAWTALIYALLTMVVAFAAPLAYIGAYMAGVLGQSKILTELMQYLPYASPPFMLAVVTAPEAGAAPPLNLLSVHGWLWCSLFTIAVGWGVGLFSSLVLRRVMLAEARGWSAGSSGFVPGAGVRGRGRRKARRSSRQRTSSRTVCKRIEAPVFWRDRKLPMVKSRAGKALLALLVLTVGGLFYYYGEYDEMEFHLVLTNLVLVVLLATAATVTTNTITAEREARSLDVLLTTPMSVHSIIGQKFMGNMVRLLPGPLFLVGHYLVFGIRGDTELWQVGHVFAVTIGYTSLLVGSGLLVGTMFKRPITAMATNMGLALALWIGLPIAMAITNELLRTGDNFLPGTVALSVNPVYLIATGIMHAFDRTAGNEVEFGMRWDTIQATTYHVIVYASSFVALLAGLLLTRMAGWWLRRSYRRCE
ncbi:MAG: ABC transporter permease subunit [Phycisphaerales bacterium]